AVTLIEQRINYYNYYLFYLLPISYIGIIKYREDSILLPFSHLRTKYNTPNL
ncbi:hypothetical protein BCR34DRAFT_496699, partial [Clohesyomyces aquaticus]